MAVADVGGCPWVWLWNWNSFEAVSSLLRVRKKNGFCLARKFEEKKRENKFREKKRKNKSEKRSSSEGAGRRGGGRHLGAEGAEGSGVPSGIVTIFNFLIFEI